VLFTEEEVAAGIKALGKQISEKYAGKPLLLVGFMKGAFVFLADLMRAIDIPCEMTFMAAKVWFPDDKNTNGTIEVKLDVRKDRFPKSLEVVTLVDKPSCRLVDFVPDAAVFTVDDCFVIGCGMDCSEHYRNLPYLAEYDRG